LISKTVTVLNKVGIHARPASRFVSEAAKYQCSITVKKGAESASAKSITRILRLRVKMDDIITLEADGPDEGQAIQALAGLIESKFGEDEPTGEDACD